MKIVMLTKIRMKYKTVNANAKLQSNIQSQN